MNSSSEFPVAVVSAFEDVKLDRWLEKECRLLEARDLTLGEDPNRKASAKFTGTSNPALLPPPCDSVLRLMIDDFAVLEASEPSECRFDPAEGLFPNRSGTGGTSSSRGVLLAEPDSFRKMLKFMRCGLDFADLEESEVVV